MGAMNCSELRRHVALEGVETVVRVISEAIKEKKLKPDDFSIRDLAESFIEDGSEWVRNLTSRKGGFKNLQEAANAVDTTAFSNITGQIVYNKILEGYENPDFLWPNVCETIPTQFINGERMAGIGGLGDAAELVDEAMPYPMVGTNEEYVDTPATQRRGMIVPVTRDIIIADRTGLLMDRCGNTGHYLGINKEKRVLDAVLGVTNSYKRNGTATNTYLTSGAYINQATNLLVNYTNIEAAELGLSAITDPNTGEPILQNPNTIIVPLALRKTAERIVNATQVGAVDNTVSASTIRTYFNNLPKLQGSGGYTILTSAYVKQRTNSATNWFLGDPKKCFAYMEVWKIETEQAGNNSEMAFTNDIFMRFKVSERGVPAIKNPRFMYQSTN